jgi:hypothetical protein
LDFFADLQLPFVVFNLVFLNKKVFIRQSLKPGSGSDVSIGQDASGTGSAALAVALTYFLIGIAEFYFACPLKKVYVFILGPVPNLFPHNFHVNR